MLSAAPPREQMSKLRGLFAAKFATQVHEDLHQWRIRGRQTAAREARPNRRTVMEIRRFRRMFQGKQDSDRLGIADGPRRRSTLAKLFEVIRV
jgi:hypothetical protein